MRARYLLTLVTMVLLAMPPEVSAATWVEAKSPNFTVYSDAGERRARAVAWQFEQIRAALSRLWPWARVDFDRPVVVYAARDERTMRELVPEFFEGRNAIKPASVFVSSTDGHYVALNSDLSTGGAVNVNPYITSYWSYVSLILRSSIDRELPPWFARGFAEVFSNTIVRENEIQIGQIIPWHLERLREASRPTLDVMLAADAASPYLTRGDRMNTFDATAWALVHYMMFGNRGKNIPLFNEFAEAVRRGAAPVDALTKAYGSVTAIRDGLVRYIDQTLYVYQKAKVAVEIDAARFTTRQVTPPDSALALARLHVAMERPVEARAQLATAGAAGAELEGVLLEREGKRDEARAAYARASEAGAASFFGEYRLAALSWPSGQNLPANTFAPIEKMLKRSVSLNPMFAPAHQLLTDALLRQEKYDAALPMAQRSIALENPDVHGYLLLARAYWGVSKSPEATAAAKRALSLATRQDDRQRAQQMLDFLAKSSGHSAPALQADAAEISADEGKKLFDACNANDSAACQKLSDMFDRSCKTGDARGCMMTAFFLLEGRGVAKDEAKGMAILEPLCDGGMPEACVPIANVLLARGDAANRARAKELLGRSCQAGAAEACTALKTLQ
jgi:tetratricopeptide (TPR) repeat protein